MKNFLIFLGGFFCGILFVGLIDNFLYTDTTDNGLTLFEEDGKCFHTNSLEIFQALGKGKALAKIGKSFDYTLVLLLDENDKSFYDGEKIAVSKDKCAKQVGTYQYETKNEIMKTVPVVVIK